MTEESHNVMTTNDSLAAGWAANVKTLTRKVGIDGAEAAEKAGSFKAAIEGLHNANAHRDLLTAFNDGLVGLTPKQQGKALLVMRAQLAKVKTRVDEVSEDANGVNVIKFKPQNARLTIFQTEHGTPDSVERVLFADFGYGLGVKKPAIKASLADQIAELVAEYRDTHGPEDCGALADRMVGWLTSVKAE